MTSFTWDDMDFWSSGEWQVIQERLDDMDKAKISYNPSREYLFAALDAVPFAKVRCVILGQDPYPDKRYASGIAFHTGTDDIPATLGMIYREYMDDLSLDEKEYPTNGNLMPWCNQGVLLWNVIPSCETGASLSHEWEEWKFLTQEILQRITQRCIVVVALGGVAREYVKYVDTFRSRVIETSHPSPRGNLNSKTPFLGSRLFSNINDKLNALGLEPINWRL